MSDKTESKSPSFHAFQVEEGKEGRAYFNRIGAAFAHKDGKGHNVVLQSVPVDGRITLRTPQERVKAAKEGERPAPEQAAEHAPEI